MAALIRVEQARRRRELAEKSQARAQAEFERAMIMAHQAGCSGPEIARYAGVTRQWVSEVVNRWLEREQEQE